MSMATKAKPAENIELLPERHLLEKAKWASETFSSYASSEVDSIVEAVAAKAAEKAGFYADWAVKETGYGVVEDKTYKNQCCSSGMAEYYRKDNYAGFEVNPEKKIIKFARPAGVVLALVPSTNPIATTYFKIILCLKTRNSIIISPHPAAKESCAAVCDELAVVAEAHGAPKGVIQVVRTPTVPLVGALMGSDKVNVILATGGPAMVRAAYGSGNPAIGVGPGNVPHYVDDTADIEKAAKRIVQGVSFDNNLLCTCDSVVLAERKIGDTLSEAMMKNGTHPVTDPTEQDRLREFLFPKGMYNPSAIGKSAEWIAKQTNIRIKPGTKVLGVEISRIDYKEVFSREKMFPVVGFLKVDGLHGALRAARAMIRMGGLGHSAAIHSKNPDAIVAWGATLKVYRVAVNGVATLTSSGYASGLSPAATIGTGYFGRSSIGENLCPEHLVHWTRVAYNEDPSEVMGDIKGALGRWSAKQGQNHRNSLDPAPATAPVHPESIYSPPEDKDELKDIIRKIILEEINDALKVQGN